MTKINVLIIDRDPQVGGEISKRLIQHDGMAILCNSISNAIGTYWGKEFDAVLLDLQLPEIANLDGLGHVLDAFPGAPVIALAQEDGNKSARRLLQDARRRGATYLLRKPLDLQETMDAVLDAAALKAGKARTHVLVVDDSPTVQKITTKMLEQAGYHVSTFPSMEDAMRAMVLLNIDVVVTDIFMPGIGGLEGVVRILKAWPDTGVVAMSSGLDTRMSCEEALRAASKSGATRTLSKPFKPQALLQAVQEVTPDKSRQQLPEIRERMDKRAPIKLAR